MSWDNFMQTRLEMVINLMGVILDTLGLRTSGTGLLELLYEFVVICKTNVKNGS